MVVLVVLILAAVLCVGLAGVAGLRARRDVPGYLGNVPSARRMVTVTLAAFLVLLVVVVICIAIGASARTSGLIAAVIAMVLITLGLVVRLPAGRE